MDPITIIVAALATGAAAGLKPTAEQAIKDAYAGFKALIQSKYSTLSVESLEQKPDSKAKQASIAEDFKDAGADTDMELMDQAKTLLDAVNTHDRAAAAKIDLNYDEVVAEYFKLKGAMAEGDINVSVKKGKFTGGIDIEALTAGTSLGKK